MKFRPNWRRGYGRLLKSRYRLYLQSNTICLQSHTRQSIRPFSIKLVRYYVTARPKIAPLFRKICAPVARGVVLKIGMEQGSQLNECASIASVVAGAWIIVAVLRLLRQTQGATFSFLYDQSLRVTDHHQCLPLGNTVRGPSDPMKSRSRITASAGSMLYRYSVRQPVSSPL